MAPSHAESELSAATDDSTVPGPPEDLCPPYTLFAVFRLSSSHPLVFDGHDVRNVVREIEDVIDLIENEGVQFRGCYDVSGMRHDADIMLWLHGDAPEDLQWALRALRRTAVLTPLIRCWGAVAAHHDDAIEVTSTHAAVTQIGDPLSWLTVCPITFKNEWHELPAIQRGKLLDEQWGANSEQNGVRMLPAAAFTFGDYEWILPIEADDLSDLSNFTRALRDSEFWRYTESAAPLFTGRRIELAELIEVLQ